MVFCCTRRYTYQPPPSRRDQHRSPELIRSPVASRDLHTATGVSWSRPFHSKQSVFPQPRSHQSMLPPTTQGTRGTAPAFPQGPYNRYILLPLSSRSKLEACNAPSTDSNSPATSDPRYPVSFGSSPGEIHAWNSSLKSFVPFQCYRTTSSMDPFGIRTPNVDSLASWNA